MQNWGYQLTGSSRDANENVDLLREEGKELASLLKIHMHGAQIASEMPRIISWGRGVGGAIRKYNPKLKVPKRSDR